MHAERVERRRQRTERRQARRAIRQQRKEDVESDEESDDEGGEGREGSSHGEGSHHRRLRRRGATPTTPAADDGDGEETRLGMRSMQEASEFISRERLVRMLTLMALGAVWRVPPELTAKRVRPTNPQTSMMELTAAMRSASRHRDYKYKPGRVEDISRHAQQIESHLTARAKVTAVGCSPQPKSALCCLSCIPLGL